MPKESAGMRTIMAPKGKVISLGLGSGKCSGLPLYQDVESSWAERFGRHSIIVPKSIDRVVLAFIEIA